MRNTTNRGDDLTGQTFGEVTVFKKAEPLPTTKGNRWWVRCSCGTEKIVSAKSLKSGDTKSCGCLSKRNLVGDTFSELTVLREDPIKQGKKRRWICQCSCGNTTSVATNDLTSGHTRSCGCAKGKLISSGVTTHGLRDHPLYGRWSAMKNRCYNPNDDYYHNYGGRGIKVCNRWRNSIDNFLEDMGMPPEGYTLDRKDNNKDYSPENCRWATNKEQGRNKSDTVWLEYGGRRVTRIDLAEEHGVDPNRLRQRLEKGWDLELALTPPFKSGSITEPLVGLNLETRQIVFSVHVDAMASLIDISKHKIRSAVAYRVSISGVWVFRQISDKTPWNDHKGCTGVSEEVILKQPNGPDVIFSDVREAYRYLTEHSLLDKEYRLEVFE